MDCTICIAKTKAMISCAVTVELICVFVFAYAKSRFSHNEAHIVLLRAYSLNGMFRITFRNEPYHERKQVFAYAKTKVQINLHIIVQAVWFLIYSKTCFIKRPSIQVTWKSL